MQTRCTSKARLSCLSTSQRLASIARWPASTIALALTSLITTQAHAGGLELGPGGTQSASRGGAVAAKPIDAMAISQNPAGLSFLPSDQVMLNLDTGFHDMCVDLYGYYGWGVYTQKGSPDPVSEFGSSTSSAYGTRELGSVCNTAPVVSQPQMAWVFRVAERLTFGLGFVSPTLVTGLHYGGPNGTIAGPDGNALPTPTRYQLVRQEVPFALNPTVSGSFVFSPMFSAGLTFQVAMAKVRSFVVSTQNAGTSPHDDMMTELESADYFVPGGTLSAMLRPTQFLSLVAAFRFSDDFRAPGTLRFTTNLYQAGAQGNEWAPYRNPATKLRQVQVSVPWVLTLGGRFAMPRNGQLTFNAPTTATVDPLSDELWDIEFDYSYNLNSRASKNQVDVGEDIQLVVRKADGTPQSPLLVSHQDLESLVVNRHLKNSVAYRLGGTLNVLPGRLGLSAGSFFESRGVDPAYASVDSFAFARLGLGGGVILRLGPFDLQAAYQHIFQETLDVVPPPHQARELATDDPKSGFDERIYKDGALDPRPTLDPSVPKSGDAVAAGQQSALFETGKSRARVINAGHYTASFDIVSVGLSYKF